MRKNDVPELLDFSDLCEIFKCCRRTIETMHATGQIPAGFLVGRRRFWRAIDVQDFINREAAKAASRAR